MQKDLKMISIIKTHHNRDYRKSRVVIYIFGIIENAQRRP
jgi:hypothetical protein